MIGRAGLLLALSLATASSLAAAVQTPRATVLCYHVVESPQDTPFLISRGAFEHQMRYLANAGYTVIPLADLVDYVAGRKESIPDNSVVITVDDGWRSTYTEIFPVMERMELPFTVFVYPKFVGASAYALTWKQIKEMSDAGVDIQSHSLSHPMLTHRNHQSLTKPEYNKWLRRELGESKRLLEEGTGRAVKYIAYPYGEYDTTVARTAAASGYEGGLTCDYGPVKKGSDPLRMRRVVMYGDTSFSTFRRYVGANPLEIDAPTPKPGGTFNEAQPVVSVKLRHFQKLDPASVGMAVLSLGDTPFSYDPRDGSISMVVRDELKGDIQQVVVWGEEAATGKRVEATWSFRIEPAGATPPAATGGAASASTQGRVESRKKIVPARLHEPAGSIEKRR